MSETLHQHNEPSLSDLGPAAAARLAKLHHVGEFTAADASARGLDLVETAHGAEGTDEHVKLWLLVDAGDVVRDARLRSPATGVQLLAYDLLAESCIGKRLAECATLNPAHVQQRLSALGCPVPLAVRGDPAQPYYVLIKAAKRREGVHEAEQAPAAKPTTARELPWTEIGLFEKVRRIEAVLDAQVRPALASDGGGIDLVDLKSDELVVQYHGACGSCASSIGGTLQFITDTLNTHLHTALRITVQGDSEGPSITGY